MKFAKFLGTTFVTEHVPVCPLPLEALKKFLYNLNGCFALKLMTKFFLKKKSRSFYYVKKGNKQKERSRVF